MAAGYSRQKVLIVVRTYPAPANKGAEVSCTAAISEEGEWRRLFPIPYRLLDPDKKFHKYQWIEADLIKASSDTRPESFHPNLDSIRILSEVDTRSGWQLRKNVLAPLIRPSLCSIQAARDANGFPTLGIFKPKQIKRLVIQKEDEEWTPEDLAKLGQLNMFVDAPEEPLEKIPFRFSYEFTCQDVGCHGHKLMCSDWEMAQTFRRWRNDYGDGWKKAFRQRWERDMIEKYDTHFYVGTVHGHPNAWIIVGLFYPPKNPQSALPGF